MNFWEMRDLALIKLRQEAIGITKEFEKNNLKDKNYHRKLHRLLNRRLGEKTKILTKRSINTTLKNLNIVKTPE